MLLNSNFITTRKFDRLKSESIPMTQFLDHLTQDAMPALIERLATPKEAL
jgi:hypothetical protein